MIRNLQELMTSDRGPLRQRVAVAAAADEDVLRVAERARCSGLADFILIGNREQIVALAAQGGIPIELAQIIDVPDEVEAARKAVLMVASGDADLLMKGMIQTGDFLRAVLHREKAGGVKRLLSQITVLNKDDGSGLMFVTDCAMNVAPTVWEKKQIIDNVVAVANALGNPRPKVAVLAAVELVNLDMQETIDAATLSKMSDRGQIKNAVVDGPLALDNAISVEAAAHKKISGPVAGQADILIAPDLNTGNVLHKSLIHLAHKTAASVVMGADCPIIMTSRADSADVKLLSVALAAHLAGLNARSPL